MPTPTYTPIANVTLASSASSVTFSSISSSYRDVICVATIISSANNSQPFIRFNSDTGSNYSTVRITGDGSSAASSSYTEDALAIYNSGMAANQSVTVVVQVMDYSATDKHKAVLTRWNTSFDTVAAGAHRWASTSAISTISFGPFRGIHTQPFAAGSTFALYGIAA